jgi:tetratricopeptide (TPR) repeat protein
VVVWIAREARSRPGSDVQHTPTTPLVGRDEELALLLSALNRARREASPQLVTLVGVPGIGKSRLVWELFQRAEQDADLITWRQGRSLPYGEGVAFWALGEIVKAQAGILDSDTVSETGAKLHRAVTGLIPPEGDGEWVEGHLRPLLGLAALEPLAGDRQAEVHAAWRRFIEALAERGTTVLVFEDIHWADDALLDFVDHLVEWASGVPLLVLCTARPEILERRRGWGGGKPNALTVALSPLSPDETARLVAAKLEQALLPAEVQRTLLDRAEGNPLYAEEYLRMLIDRGVIARSGRHWRVQAGVDLPLPESVQGIIAARLDALSGDEKALLQAAAVLGKVFWLGAVASVSSVGRRHAEEHLHRLERKEFVRRERVSSVAGEVEYAFRHILVRDVAYGQLPRAKRARRHEDAAGWIDALAGERGDRVEMLAHHYGAALDLHRASGPPPETLCERARTAFRDAGDHAFALNAYAVASAHYRAALELWPRHAADRPDVLFALAKARYHGEDAFPPELEEAREALAAAGDVDAAVEAETMVGVHRGNHGDSTAAMRHLERAVALARAAPASRAGAWALASLASGCAILGRPADALALANECLAIARDLGLEEIRAEALSHAALALFDLDRPECRSRTDESVAVAERGESPSRGLVYLNAAGTFHALGDLAAAVRVQAACFEFARRLGLAQWLRAAEMNQVATFYLRGSWDNAATTAARHLADIAAGATSFSEADLAVTASLIELARGNHERADVLIGRAERCTADLGAPSTRSWALAARAWFCAHVGRRPARAQADELVDLASNYPHHCVTAGWPFAWAIARSRHADELASLAESRRLKTPWLEAFAHVCRGEYARAADAYGRIPSRPDEAHARHEAGKKLILDGRRGDGEVELQECLAFWREVGATAYADNVQSFLQRASA